MKERIEQYIVGMEAQLEDAKKQAAMIEGALQFAHQLIEDLSADEVGEKTAKDEEMEGVLSPS